jgi:hypothetical protein
MSMAGRNGSSNSATLSRSKTEFRSLIFGVLAVTGVERLQNIRQTDDFAGTDSYLVGPRYTCRDKPEIEISAASRNAGESLR